MPPRGPGGPGGPRGGGPGGGRGYGMGPLSGGRSYGSMMRPPGGYWGENSGPLSPDRPRSSGYTSDDDSYEVDNDQTLATKAGRNIYQAQLDQEKKALRSEGVTLDRGTPIQGKDIRTSSRIKGFFIGIGRTLSEPFSSLRSDFAADISSQRYGDGVISKEEHGRRMYSIEERKLYKAYKRGSISVEEYNAGCDRLEQQYLGVDHTNGGPTR